MNFLLHKIKDKDLATLIKKYKEHTNVAFAVFAYYCYLLKKIKNGEGVRASVIKKFINFFDKPLLDRNKMIEDFLMDAEVQVYDKLVKLKGYDFSIEISPLTKEQFEVPPKFIFKRSGKLTYSLRGFLKFYFKSLTLFSDFESLLLHGKTVQKETFITFTYTKLCDYLRPIPEANKITPYKKRVIVGLLCSKFGLLPTEQEYDKNPKQGQIYTEYLQDQTKHFCKKAEKQLLK